MSKSFLKVSEAYTKLGLSGGGTNWIKKSELIATGKCDTSLLEKYGNNDFVVDDDIVKKVDNNHYYTTIFIPNINLGIFYTGYGNWAYSFYLTISGTWRQYLAILIVDKNLLNLGYNIKGNLATGNLAIGKCVGIPKLNLPEINNDTSWKEWYNTYNLDYFKKNIINSGYPYSNIPASSLITYDLQKAKYQDSNFFLITLDNLNTDKLRKACGIISNFTYTKNGFEDITAVYAEDKKFY